MQLKIQQFVEEKLKKAQYEYDESVSQWAGWVLGSPNLYAQGDSIESTRDELAKIIEENALFELIEKGEIEGLKLRPLLNYASSN